MHSDYTICMAICWNGLAIYGEYINENKLNPKGPETGALKVARGGGWFEPIWKCRSAYRGGGIPPGNRGAGISFRLVKSE